MGGSERPLGVYLRGEELYGDDFGPEQLDAWYADEKEAYADLGAGDTASYRYSYHALNAYHAYRFLPSTPFANALGFGAAYGDELLPLSSRIKAITIVEPSDAFEKGRPSGAHAVYVKPLPRGGLPLDSDVFDLVTCLGVLHHIPNVSFVVGELARVLKPGGWLVMREPICSMGRWDRPRKGLTMKERGIPLVLLRRIVQTAGLDLLRISFCGFPVVPRLFRLVRPDVYNSATATRIDAVLSALFSWNVRYHPRNLVQRLRPVSVFLVLRKPARAGAAKLRVRSRTARSPRASPRQAFPCPGKNS